MTSYQAFEDYVPPAWSAKPTHAYYLEVLKNGVECERKNIDQKAMYLVGKHKEVCDIVLDNPSISRKHALFQSKNSGEMFLFDLGSTHGTFVNGAKVPSRLFHRLNIFDQVRFGQSQRIYVLRCTKLEDEDGVKQEQEIHERAERKKQKKEFRSLKDEYLSLLERDPSYGFRRGAKPSQQQQQEEGISWGMIDEEEIYRYQAEQEYPLEPELLKLLTGLTTSQSDKVNNYAEKLATFRQVQQEYDVLVAKERQNYGLEEASKRKKETLEARIEDDGQALEQAEETCRFVLFGDKVRARRTEMQKADSSEDDEFYDNTLRKQVKQSDQETLETRIKKLERTTETFKELKAQLELLTEEQAKVHGQLLRLGTGQEEKSTEGEVDVLDQFMEQTNRNLAEEARPKLLARLAEIQNQSDEVCTLLRIVKPDVDTKTIRFTTEEEDEEEGRKKQKEEAEKGGKKQGVGSTLEKLKALRKEKDLKEKNEDDDEANLEQARKDFEELEKRRTKQEKELQKREERLRKLQADSDEEIDGGTKKRKQVTPMEKPHSRHYREQEIEGEEIVDIVQFQ